MKQLLSLMIALIAASGVTAQYSLPENNIWAFGYEMGMNFSGPDPFPVFTSIRHGEGCASVCNPNGQLLFYSNGNKIWSANGSLFPNGQNLDITQPVANTTTQTALVVPAPGQAGKYYLFTLGNKLFCYRIDMSLNGGTGDVDLSFPLTHVVLRDTLSEKMIAVRGCSNNVWVVVRSNYKNQFYAYNITAQGIDTAAVVSETGFSPPQSYFQQTMTASPDGSKIVANTANRIELFHFDKTNGTISGYKIVDNQFCYGSCFSPDGRLLYANAVNIYQYDLTACDPAATKRTAGIGFLGDIKLAPNGKIYFRSEVNAGTHNYLGCIEQPDVYGPGCQFRDSVSGTAMPILNPTAAGTFSLGLTNTVVKASPEETQLNRLYFDTCICQFPYGAGLELQAAAGFQSYQWPDGSGGNTFTASGPGTYWVGYMTSCGRRFDTFRVSSYADPVTLTYSPPLIQTSGSYQSYTWYKDGNLLAGANGADLEPQSSGVYSVVVANAEGCTDSAFLNINMTDINGGKSIPAFSVSIFPNPATTTVHIESPVPVNAALTDISGSPLLRTKGKPSIDISTLSAGIYLIRITDAAGRLITVKKLIRKE